MSTFVAWSKGLLPAWMFYNLIRWTDGGIETHEHYWHLYLGYIRVIIECPSFGADNASVVDPNTTYPKWFNDREDLAANRLDGPLKNFLTGKRPTAVLIPGEFSGGLKLDHQPIEVQRVLPSDSTDGQVFNLFMANIVMIDSLSAYGGGRTDLLSLDTDLDRRKAPRVKDVVPNFESTTYRLGLSSDCFSTVGIASDALYRVYPAGKTLGNLKGKKKLQDRLEAWFEDNNTTTYDQMMRLLGKRTTPVEVVERIAKGIEKVHQDTTTIEAHTFRTGPSIPSTLMQRLVPAYRSA